jgi:pimeloyl-ACP methyl ester carboxylesterase
MPTSGLSPVPEAPPAEAGLIAHYRGAHPPRPVWADAALSVEPATRWITVAGARIEVLRWGAPGGKGLLLAHGNGAHARWWSFLAPLLAAEGRTVVAASFSGMGGSDWRDAYTLDLFAEELIAAAEAEGLFAEGRRPVFAGHSFGGFPVLAAARALGDRLAGVMMLDSAIEPPGEMWDGPPRRTRPNAVYPTLEAALARFRLAPPQPCETDWAIDWIARYSLKQVDGAEGRGWTWRFDPFLWNSFRMADPTPLLQGLCAPLCVMRGEQSALAAERVMAHMKTLVAPGALWVSVPQARHHLMLDQPLATLAAMRGVLAAWDA